VSELKWKNDKEPNIIKNVKEILTKTKYLMELEQRKLKRKAEDLKNMTIRKNM
jgi:hypothetical protein